MKPQSTEQRRRGDEMRLYYGKLADELAEARAQELAASLHLQPLTYREACAYIAEHHRHHAPPQGVKFCIGINDGENVVGCITVGRPVARMLDDGYTAEVTRCCVQEGVPNGCSKLYAAAWRAARAMGYTRLITYTLASEPGTSLTAAGWREVYRTADRDRSWDTPTSGRPRVDSHPLGQKTLWEQTA